MKIIIDLPENLLADLETFAAKTQRTLEAIMVDALRQHLDMAAEMAKREPVRLYTVDGPGVRPGVKLDRSGKLLDLME